MLPHSAARTAGESSIVDTALTFSRGSRGSAPRVRQELQMAASTKMGGLLFPRKRYTGGTTSRHYSPLDRSKTSRLLGQGYRLHLHSRVYDRSGSGNPVVAVDFLHGCFEGEFPEDALRYFILTPTTTTPSLPYDATNMPSLPDDGYIMVQLGMGVVDVGLQVTGSGDCWVEMEVWYTLELQK